MHNALEFCREAKEQILRRLRASTSSQAALSDSARKTARGANRSKPTSVESRASSAQHLFRVHEAVLDVAVIDTFSPPMAV
jgi:hypothetical protein